MKAAIGSLQSSLDPIKMMTGYPLTNLMVIAFGAMLIWLGPSLSGYGALHGAWCTSSNASPLAQMSNLAWLATQHCPYCYVGAAFIAFGFVGAYLGRIKRA